MKNILYVCPTRQIASDMEHRFPKLDTTRFVSPGGSLCGEGYDIVILFEWYPFEPQDRRWFEETIMTRLLPHSQMLHANRLLG